MPCPAKPATSRRIDPQISSSRPQIFRSVLQQGPGKAARAPPPPPCGPLIGPRVTNGSNANSCRDNEIVYIDGVG